MSSRDWRCMPQQVIVTCNGKCTGPHAIAWWYQVQAGAKDCPVDRLVA